MTLRIDNLAHSYGPVHALRGITVQAQPGGITTLLGPNAAGKSTLLRCITGALRPTAGAVLLDERATHGIAVHELAARLAYVPQRSTVAAAFTVREVVELGRYARPAATRFVDRALQRMELTDLAQRSYEALSVGQQQRVTLARALAQLDDPSQGVLILDEPMSAMDLRHVRDVTTLLRELAEMGMTIIIAMHDLTLAASIANEVWLVDDGRLAAAGNPCDVLSVERLEAVYDVPFTWLEGRLLTA